MFSFYKATQDGDIYFHFVNENLISEFQISKITFITENSGFGSFSSRELSTYYIWLLFRKFIEP